MYYQQAVDLTTPIHLDRANFYYDLANAVLTRFQRAGKTQDLYNGIAYHREALQLRRPGHRDRPSSLDHLAKAVYIRYTQLGNIDDL